MANRDQNGTRNVAEGEHSHALKSDALDWFMRLRDDSSPEALAEFNNWIDADAARLKAYERIEIMYSMPSLRMATQSDIAGRTLSGSVRMPVASRRLISRRWQLGGAALASLMVIAVGISQFQNVAIWWASDFQTAYGEQQTVTLSDGSTVLLNTGSAIAVDYNGRERRVALLRGDAFFDVQHDVRHPFIVTGHFSDVTVTGTAFGVQLDQTADTIVLERGSVEVGSLTNPTDRVQLHPGETVRVSNKDVSPVEKADVSRELSWKSGRVIFHDRPFQSALNELTRYYSGTVFVLTDTSELPAVSGNYRIDDTEAAIRTFAASSNLVATRLPGDIFILR